MKNSLKFKNKFKNMKVNNYNVKVVIPMLIQSEEGVYCVSKYKGLSLENYYYDNLDSINIFSINTLYSLLNEFLKKGIYYYDFVPRNVIVQDDNIHLVDFENVIFSSNLFYDIRWQTNFLLNWSYIYDLSILKKHSKNLIENSENINNYTLSNFEKNFKKITEINGDSLTVRNIILSTVLISEKKTNKIFNGLVPIDLCHFISDILGTKIDVFVDIQFYLIRLKSEEKFIYFLNKLNEEINLFDKDIVKKRFMSIIFDMNKYIYKEYLKGTRYKKTENIFDSNIIGIFKNIYQKGEL